MEAMADQRIREQHIRLIVAGEFYGNADFYQKLIEQYGIEDLLVMHTDYIPSEVMNDYFVGQTWLYSLIALRLRAA